jgi:dTDP-4-amino-4,6-dideoxygalactose transaminase
MVTGSGTARARTVRRGEEEQIHGRGAVQLSVRVPMNDVSAQLAEIGGELERAVLEVVRSGAYIMGPAVARLEAAMAEKLGVRHAIGVSSGTDALLVALMALEVGPGDRVITSTYSFFASAGAVARLGATPVLLDIDPRTYNLDPAALASWFAVNGPARVKAIIPVHLFGQCADMDAIRRVSGEHGVPLIEDAAQAIGATYPTGGSARQAGTMGAMGAFSFFPSKNLGGIGDGGLVVTDDDGLADRVRRLRVHGAKPKYHHALVGGNFRLDTIQAAALLVKLPHLDRWSARRREVAARYDAALAGPAAVYGREHHVYNQYLIRSPARDGLQKHLAGEGIDTAIFYPVPFHLQECFRSLGHRRGDFPHAEAAAAETLALPIYPEMTATQQDHVIAAIDRFG